MPRPNLLPMLFALLLTPLSPALADDAAPAAKVLAARGEVIATREGAPPRPLERGSPVYSGETIITGNGEAQIRFSDQALLTLYTDTRFAIDDYRFSEETADDGRAEFSLLQGLIHTLSGKVGKRRPERYKLETSMAVLGLRGTDFRVLLDHQLHVSLLEGAVELTNQGGSLLVEGGQNAVVSAIDVAPRMTRRVIDPAPFRWRPTPLPTTSAQTDGVGEQATPVSNEGSADVPGGPQPPPPRQDAPPPRAEEPPHPGHPGLPDHGAPPPPDALGIPDHGEPPEPAEPPPPAAPPPRTHDLEEQLREPRPPGPEPRPQGPTPPGATSPTTPPAPRPGPLPQPGGAHPPSNQPTPGAPPGGPPGGATRPPR